MSQPNHMVSGMVMLDLARAVHAARRKHPRFNTWKLVAAAMEELGEVARALLEGDHRQARVEALQVAAVMIRLVEEHLDSGDVDDAP